MLDQAKLAVVAYAEVVGGDGSSTLTNSGIFTTKLAIGTYEIDLSRTPSGAANQQGLLQASDRDLIFVTPHNSAPSIDPIYANGPVSFACETDDQDAARKYVYMGTSPTTAVDASFCVVIYRTLTPPVPGGPA